jgi:hypothetical protein
LCCLARHSYSLLLLATKRKELEAIGTLQAYTFITKYDGRDSYDIYQLVQIAIRNWLKSRNELSLWSGKALIRVAEVFPFPKHENRATWAIYLPHTQRVLSFQEYSSDFEKLIPSQHTTPRSNMKQVELDILQDW